MSKKFIVASEAEKFTRSNCGCDFCTSTHKAVMDWDTFVPKNALQSRMLETIADIEDREQTKIRKNKRPKM